MIEKTQPRLRVSIADLISSYTVWLSGWSRCFDLRHLAYSQREEGLARLLLNFWLLRGTLIAGPHRSRIRLSVYEDRRSVLNIGLHLACLILCGGCSRENRPLPTMNSWCFDVGFIKFGSHIFALSLTMIAHAPLMVTAGSMARSRVVPFLCRREEIT